MKLDDAEWFKVKLIDCRRELEHARTSNREALARSAKLNTRLIQAQASVKALRYALEEAKKPWSVKVLDKIKRIAK